MWRARPISICPAGGTRHQPSSDANSASVSTIFNAAFYYLHRVDPLTPIEDSLGTIREYRDRGHIRFVGVSQVTVEQLERARRVVPIAAVQNEYSVSERRYDSVVDY